MHRRGVLLAILIYVTLDLSLPAIPGAFVFAPDDSVESVQVNRGRSAAEVVVAPPLAGHSSVLSQPSIDLRILLVPRIEVTLPPHPVVNRLPRGAIVCSAPTSEDSH